MCKRSVGMLNVGEGDHSVGILRMAGQVGYELTSYYEVV